MCLTWLHWESVSSLLLWKQGSSRWGHWLASCRSRGGLGWGAAEKVFAFTEVCVVISRGFTRGVETSSRLRVFLPSAVAPGWATQGDGHLRTREVKTSTESVGYYLGRRPSFQQVWWRWSQDNRNNKMMLHGVWVSKLSPCSRRLKTLMNSVECWTLSWTIRAPKRDHSVVMILHFLYGLTCGFSNSNICAVPEWLALKTTCPAAMQAVVPRAQEGPPDNRLLLAPTGCTSRRWLKEPGPWLFTTPFLSNRTASALTALCSSSARITSYGNTPKRSQNGHILTATSRMKHQ